MGGILCTGAFKSFKCPLKSAKGSSTHGEGVRGVSIILKRWGAPIYNERSAFECTCPTFYWFHPSGSCCVRQLRGEPTESIDGYYHRNKTIIFWSNVMTCLYRKYMVFPLKVDFFIENGLLDYKIR